MSENQDIESRRFWWTVALAPLLSYALITASALGIGISFFPGVPGVFMMTLAGIPLAILIGFVIACCNPTAVYAPAAFAGLVTVMLYWSVRWQLIGSEGWSLALSFILIWPCFLLGAHSMRLLYGQAKK